jgi:hypothetical protein
MTPEEEFQEEVQESVYLYLTDYFKPEIEWDFEDTGDPKAYITISLSNNSEIYILTVGLDEDGNAGVECGESIYLPLDSGGFMTCLFLEAHERLGCLIASVDKKQSNRRGLRH